MVLPLIPLVLFGLGGITGATGVVTGVQGGLKLKEAESIAAAARKRYDESTAVTERRVQGTNDRCKRYGLEQARARQLVIKRMAAFMALHQQKIRERAAQLLDGVDVDEREVQAFAGALTADVNWLKGAGTAALAGAGTYIGIPGAAAAIGTASTGTAIGSLSGAAAQNATMAWLGGGSLAAGGGGVALGTAALGVVTIGPTMLLGGLTLNGQGEKAVTKAKKYKADVAVAVGWQTAFRSSLDILDRRIEEVSAVLGRLVRLAQDALSTLERLDFDPEQHAPEFQRALTLTLAVRDLCLVPLLSEDGEINVETIRLVLKHKETE